MSKQKQDPFTSEFSITTTDGKVIPIYPMKLRHKDKICRFMAQFNDTFIFLNFMSPALNDDSSVQRDDEGNIVFSNKEYNALKEVVSMATHIPVDELDTEDGADFSIIDCKRAVMEYLDISQLKKNMTA